MTFIREKRGIGQFFPFRSINPDTRCWNHLHLEPMSLTVYPRFLTQCGNPEQSAVFPEISAMQVKQRLQKLDELRTALVAEGLVDLIV